MSEQPVLVTSPTGNTVSVLADLLTQRGAAEVHPIVADVTGRQPLTIEQLARDYGAAITPR